MPRSPIRQPDMTSAIARFLDPQGDPQQEALYRARSDVVSASPEDAVADLHDVTDYVARLVAIHGRALSGWFRATFYDGPGPGLVVNWAGHDSDYTDARFQLPDGGPLVSLYNPDFRWSAFDVDHNAILVAGPTEGSLSHRLLLVHEIAHVINPIEKGTHGASYAQTFLELTQQHLPGSAEYLRVSFAARGVVV
jgi:hypothetical protein